MKVLLQLNLGMIFVYFILIMFWTTKWLLAPGFFNRDLLIVIALTFAISFLNSSFKAGIRVDLEEPAPWPPGLTAEQDALRRGR